MGNRLQGLVKAVKVHAQAVLLAELMSMGADALRAYLDSTKMLPGVQHVSCARPDGHKT